MREIIYDLCVIGGGINGAGIARDAAGRGLSVLLVEADDLASGTSSASTKLIHGGLRYLEYYDFKLVRQSLRERDVILSIAPHIAWPLRFTLPHRPHLRPFWLIRLGLFLYDALAGATPLPRASRVSLDQRGIFKPGYERAVSYSDCWVEDSRLVVLNALDAALSGAHVLTRTACSGLKAADGLWNVSLRDEGGENTAQARMVVNAAGPWAEAVLALAGDGKGARPSVRLIKGSHIIVKRRFEGDEAYILQQEDQRIVFAIPYERDYTLIGTTEEAYDGNPRDVMISDAEMGYLIAAYNGAFSDEISAGDVEWTYSGVRPLFDDGAQDARAVSRDHQIDLRYQEGAPMLSVFGGKLTTYRLVAQEVMDQIAELAGDNFGAWTADKVLPGGDIPAGDLKRYIAEQAAYYPWLEEAVIERLARAYGTRMQIILNGAQEPADLGVHYGGGLYEAEVRYLIGHEWACTAEDILWRRSKLGLHVGEDVVSALEAALPALLKEAL